MEFVPLASLMVCAGNAGGSAIPPLIVKDAKDLPKLMLYIMIFCAVTTGLEVVFFRNRWDLCQ